MRATVRGHLELARVDHWIKNVFVIPGIVVALSLDRGRWLQLRPWTVVVGLTAVCLIASSNYVLNEILDAPFDIFHPKKRLRPVPSGRVNVALAWLEWLVLMAVGLGLSWSVSLPFLLTMTVLWIMGCAYNIPPVRSKDIPYLDVLSEAVNNPLRLLAGWYLTGISAIPPVSLLISYWMIGCYFMAIKRFAEYREIGNAAASGAYRRSFRHYTEPKLLVSIVFYAAHAMLFFGAFLVRYRLELILCFPLIAVVMARYLELAFKPNNAAQRPEALYREPALMKSVVCCTAAMLALLFIDIPVLHRIFTPSVAVQ